MSTYIRSGNSFLINSTNSDNSHKKLPAGNYMVVSNPQTGELYLETTDLFVKPGKIYGNSTKLVERIFTTFQDRPLSTGVLLSGEKGSGKTLIAKLVALKAYKESIPTIIISEAWSGDKFCKFLQRIDQPLVVILEEFDKMYDKEEQKEMLTLFDGIFPTKKLFIVTCNNKWSLDHHLLNRPGRMYYSIDFGSLESEFIKEYCKDNLKDKKQVESVCLLSTIFDRFNFDMLKAIIEEMNRYNESPSDVLKYLNTKIDDFDSLTVYTTEFYIKNQLITNASVSDYYRGSPLKQQSYQVNYRVKTSNKEVTLTLNDLKTISNNQDVITLENGDYKLIFKRDKKFEFNLANGYSQFVEKIN